MEHVQRPAHSPRNLATELAALKKFLKAGRVPADAVEELAIVVWGAMLLYCRMVPAPTVKICRFVLEHSRYTVPVRD